MVNDVDPLIEVAAARMLFNFAGRLPPEFDLELLGVRMCERCRVAPIPRHGRRYCVPCRSIVQRNLNREWMRAYRERDRNVRDGWAD